MERAAADFFEGDPADRFRAAPFHFAGTDRLKLLILQGRHPNHAPGQGQVTQVTFRRKDPQCYIASLRAAKPVHNRLQRHIFGETAVDLVDDRIRFQPCTFGRSSRHDRRENGKRIFGA